MSNSEFDNDELLFLNEDDNGNGDNENNESSNYVLLIVDDDEDVHILTKLILEDYSFEGSKLSFLSAYSGEEAKEIMKERPDVCLVLLDVVMEEDDSGLKVVKYIREELQNSIVRIILRTGQPGRAPEHEVVSKFDINDYKTKTELTSEKLYTTLTSSLRSYRDLVAITRSREGFKKIIEATPALYEYKSLEDFTGGALVQLISLLYLGDSSIFARTPGLAVCKEKNDYRIVAATGKFSKLTGERLNENVSDEIVDMINEACKNKTNVFHEDRFLGYFKSEHNCENIMYIHSLRKLSESDREMLEVFSKNIALAFDNIYFHGATTDIQKNLIFSLAESIENKAHNNSRHVKRVALISEILGKSKMFAPSELSRLYHAALLHDIGNIGIADEIFHKPGKLTAEEYEAIKNHPKIGYNILINAGRLEEVAEIVLQHHEHMNGNGYPNRLKGDEINLSSRIVHVADVFDALCHDRVYRKAWTIDEGLDYLMENKGKEFDPEIVDLFFKNLDAILFILETNPDKELIKEA